MSYEEAGDSSPADWLTATVTTFGRDVRSVCPRGYPAYLRVFHPAYRGGSPVTWEDIAAVNDRQPHPGMQFGAITGDERHEYEPQRGVFDDPPEHGKFPHELLRSASEVLARHSNTPDHCYFGVWEGFGSLAAWVAQAPSFELPHRRYYLLTGQIESVLTSVDGPPYASPTSVATIEFRRIDAEADVTFEPAEHPPLFDHTPNIWWPADQAWCVCTEIDFNTTYVGGSVECLQALQEVSGIEALPISPDTGIGAASDTVNPRQKGLDF